MNKVLPSGESFDVLIPLTVRFLSSLIHVKLHVVKILRFGAQLGKYIDIN